MLVRGRGGVVVLLVLLVLLVMLVLLVVLLVVVLLSMLSVASLGEGATTMSADVSYKSKTIFLLWGTETI